MEFLANLDAEILKTELLCFLETKGDGDLINELVDYIQEDFSRSDG